MKTILTNLGVVAAALAASACCWIPALLGAGAAGSLGVSAALAPWRPHLLALTALFLIGGFWFAYRKPKANCEADCCATEAASRRRKVNIGVMWAVALFAIVMSAYPEVLAIRFRASHVAAPPAPASARQVVLAVKGMDCEACAAPIEENLKKVPGVLSARVDYPKAQVIVALGSPEPTEAALVKAVKNSGFEASINHKENQ